MEVKGWNNHEDTFEEALRREMLKLKKENNTLRSDLKELTKAYYRILKGQRDKNES